MIGIIYGPAAALMPPFFIYAKEKILLLSAYIARAVFGQCGVQ